jgi:hypothetical protein
MKTHEKKQLAYYLNVPMRHGEMTVVKNDHAEEAMRHAFRVAKEIHDSGVGVLLVNCGMSERRFRENFEEVSQVSEQQPALLIHTATRGNLETDRFEIEPLLIKTGIKTVIIVGWEWASDSYKRTRRLYSCLRDIMDYHNVAMLVYANASHPIEAGKFDQRGLGKLTLMAYATCAVGPVEKLEKLTPKPKPIVLPGYEYQAAERGVAELMRKVNELPGDDGGGVHEEAVIA